MKTFKNYVNENKVEFTFKTERNEPGLRSIGRNPSIQIKLNKGIVGYIHPVQWDQNEIRIVLAVENSNGGWDNKKLKFVPKTIEEAKKFLNDNIDKILKLGKLHTYEED